MLRSVTCSSDVSVSSLFKDTTLAAEDQPKGFHCVASQKDWPTVELAKECPGTAPHAVMHGELDTIDARTQWSHCCIRADYSPVQDKFGFLASPSCLLKLKRKCNQANSKKVVFIPTLLSDARSFETRNYLTTSAERGETLNIPVVVVCEPGQLGQVAHGLQRKLSAEQGLGLGASHFLLVLPKRSTGVPFSRHTAKMLADSLELDTCYFKDDDLHLKTYSYDVPFMCAQKILDYWYGRAKCKGNVGGAAAAGDDERPSERPPIVVAAARTEYCKNLPKNMKEAQGVSFGLPIDFGCARIDLRRCRDFGFLSKVARRACTEEWSRIRKMRCGELGIGIQHAFFQGEDYGFCERLAWHTQEKTKYSQSARCLTLFTYEKHTVKSAAGTATKGFSDPLPLLKHILKDIFEECYPPLAAGLQTRPLPLPTRSQSAPEANDRSYSIVAAQLET
jgi:hypothetical protein